MCGIFGVIGESFDPAASFDILTNLFAKTESRGEDASGIWGTQTGTNGAIIYHKEPVKASEFIKNPMWLKIKKFNPSLLICHARAASFGSGSPSINKNNHPFTSNDKSIGLIHNGIIKDVEYSMLKKKYNVTSQCDSEMFLRVFEHEREENEDSLEGIKKIWSYMSRSHMALAIGEWFPEGKRSLWLLRNQHRSIWLADLRGLLGQVFFFSTPDIWDEAATSCDVAGDYLRRVKQIEIPEEEVWNFNIDGKNPTPYNDQLLKFTLKKGEYKNWSFDGDPIPVIQRKPITKIVTKLDKDEEPLESAKKIDRSFEVRPFPPDFPRSQCGGIPPRQDDILFPQIEDKSKTLSTLTDLCDDIRKHVDNIETTAENLIEEGTMDNDKLGELFTSLEQTGMDLSATSRIVESLH